MALSDYTDFKNIGSGSFGIVQTAQRKPYTVVIKQVLLDRIFDEKQLKAAKDEASALARCSHPNIVRVFNVFVDKETNQLCIEMEHCAGGDLSRVIAERKMTKQPFPEADAKDWLAQMALAIGYIHDQNIVHRDIKPKNIFLSKDRQTVKIGDFGVVKFLDKSGLGNSAAMSTVSTMGTPTHMPPEALRNVDGQKAVVDFKFDVWSLGVVFFELVTFELPFQCTNPNVATVQIFESIKRNKLPPIPACYSGELKNITVRLLTVDMKKRPTMAEVINDSYLHANVQKHSEQIVSDDWTGILKRDISILKEELEEMKNKMEEDAKIRNEISAARAKLEYELREAKEKYRELKMSVRTGSAVGFDDGDQMDPSLQSTLSKSLSIEEKKKLAESLFRAAQSGNTRDILKYLERGAEINAKDSVGWTALIKAARYGKADICELLIDKGANVDAKNNDGWTALTVAANFGQTEVARALISRAADINSRNNDGWTALIAAASGGRTEVAEILIESGADLNVRNNEGWTAMMCAACNGRFEAVKVLITHQADVNLRNNDGWTALMYAASNGRNETVELLLDNEAELEARNNSGWTALVVACRYARTETVTFLIDKGADVNRKDNSNRYPYSHAKNDEIKRIILAHGGKK